MQQVIVSLSNTVVQSGINSFGAFAIAGCSNYSKLDGFIILPIMSFAMASTTFTGQNIGAEKYDRVKKGLLTSMGLTAIYTISISVVVYFFGEYGLLIFSRDAEVLRFGTTMLKTLSPFYIVLALMQAIVGAVRGAGKTLVPMITSLISLCIFRVMWVKCVLYFVNDIKWVFVGYPLSWVLGITLITLYIWKSNWLVKKEV